MNQEDVSVHNKALQVNLDKRLFGTFAEIGAGQEVARHFFQAGGAAGTIAKTISAYDMTFSDEIYGRAGRYVSCERLLAMLDHEYSLLLHRLSGKRGHDTNFFAFADTVAAKSFQGTSECHGWMGIRFQTTPLSRPNQIILHVRMLNKSNLLQQEALGIVGVNLVHSAHFCKDPAKELVKSLLDGLSKDRIEIDMIEVSGPDFESVDNRLLSLQLVQQGLSDAAMFAPCGKVLQPSEVLYKKAVIVERGSFRPITNVHVDMLSCAREMFRKDVLKKGQDHVVLAELTINNLMQTGSIDMNDFLARVDMISALGLNVLISNYSQFYRLVGYLRRYTKEPIGLALGVNTLLELFNERHYQDLEGGILESLGRMFKYDVKLYAYPMLREAFESYIKLSNPPFDDGDLGDAKSITAENLPVLKNFKLLYYHLLTEDRIVPIEGYDKKILSVLSRDTLQKISKGDPSWEDVVPKSAAEVIKKRGLLGYKPPSKKRKSRVKETEILENEDDTPSRLH